MGYVLMGVNILQLTSLARYCEYVDISGISRWKTCFIKIDKELLQSLDAIDQTFNITHRVSSTW